MGKRKNSEDQSSSRVKIVVAEKQTDVESPYLVTFSGTKPTSELEFTPYKRSDAVGKQALQRYVTGETDKVRFSGSNFGQNALDSHSKYLVGVYSKKDNSLNITNSPIMRLSRSVKALESESSVNSNVARGQAARAALGQAFGTIKARKQLQSDERNTVTGDQLEEELSNLHTDIGKSTVNIPKKEEMKQSMVSSLPVPKHNLEAESSDEAYDLTSIVSDEELNSINPKELLKETSLEGVKSHLAYRDSKFINDRLMSIIAASGKKDRKRVRTLMYINILMAYFVRVRSFDLKDRRKVDAALKNPSSVILDGLAERYTESNTRTPVMADKILLYMFTLILSVSGYSVLIDQIGKDLLLKPLKITTLFKTLCCKVDKASAEECREAKVKSAKKATLVVPLKFPEVRSGLVRR
ncbi:DNA-directed RNA polymerase I subunit rpa49 [Rhizopus stolonifer]|uniref:DNA-directed RNA polymerase I subunit rpa49 n=1 Tax=Rhizopus stolonifer TaxID=4846 RepID=A0A367KR87_RHIST|nr:DNA-directed RNA polymerase I subunit rpa49 [Rhizopus stolonifer]